MLEVACWPAAGGERRRYAGTSHIDVTKPRRRCGARRPRPERPRDLVARLLPQQPASRGFRETRREHAFEEGHRRRCEARRRHRRNVRRSRPDEERPRQLPRVSKGLAAARRLRRAAWRQDRDRELPDDLQLGRVAGRHEPRLDAGDCGTRCSRSSTATASASTSTRPTSYGSWSTTSASSATTRRRSSTSTRRTWRSTATASTATARRRSGWAGRFRACPGLGEVRWDRFVAALYRERYDFVVSIEHEDRAFEATEELVKRGFLIARDALKPLLH